ncbi:MAG: hypothetical protein ABIY63_13235 [Fibrobacteria bacterium]
MFRIKDWALHYENSESRKVKGARWLPMPNKHDGKGFRRMSRHDRKVEIFCAWTLILQVASKCPVRGDLADENGPLTPLDLEDSTGFPEEIFRLAFEVLTEARIGWIEVMPWPIPESQQIPAIHPDEKAISPDVSGWTAGIPGRAGKEGIEGREGIERRREDPPPSPRAAIPPHDPVVTAILAAYPKTREREGGRREAVHVGEGDRGKIADFLNEHPDYPLLIAVKQYAKATARPKNLREWLQNPTAREIVLKAAEDAKERDSPPAAAPGPIGPTDADRQAARAIVQQLGGAPETRRVQNVGT